MWSKAPEFLSFSWVSLRVQWSSFELYLFQALLFTLGAACFEPRDMYRLCVLVGGLANNIFDCELRALSQFLHARVSLDAVEELHTAAN